jgi:hypothetical protein
LLVPLINDVAERIEIYEPESMQTGPAIRYDAITIQKHLQLLSNQSQLKNIYEVMTASIQKFYQEQNGK